MPEKNNEGLIYVAPDSITHGVVEGHGYCLWGQAKDGKWYSINYYQNHPMNQEGFNAEVRWEILESEYDLYNIKSSK